MDIEELEKAIGRVVKLLPEPEHLNLRRQYAPVIPNEWRVEGRQDRSIELRNDRTGHMIRLACNHVRELRSNEMNVRFKLVLKGKRNVF
jgi:hypothetical protein